VAVIFGIVFSGWKIWPLGLVLSVSYTSVLCWLVGRYDHDNPQQIKNTQGGTITDTTETEEIDQAPESPPVSTLASLPPPKYPVTLSLLYLLAILSLGFPGVILTFQIFPCDYYDRYDGSFRDQYWETPNASLLPKEVGTMQVFSEYDQDFYGVGSKFCLLGSTVYIPGSNTTEGPSHLWAFSDGSTPRQVEHFESPQWLTKVNQDTMCFVALPSKGWYDIYNVRGYVYSLPTDLYCGNVSEFRKLSFEWDYLISRLAAIDGLLWYRQEKQGVDGYGIVSLDTATMEPTLHSELRQRKNDLTLSSKAYTESLEKKTCFTIMSTARALAGLFLVAMPVAIVSGLLWRKREIPSLSISLFVGIGLIAMFVEAALDPWNGVETVLIIWLWVGAPCWFILGAVRMAVNPSAAGPPLIWSWNFASFFAWTGLFILRDTTVAVVFSLFFLLFMVIGLVANSTLVIILGVLGMIIDTATLIIFQLAARHKLGLAVFLVVLEMIGFSLLGWFIYRRKDAWHNKLAALLRNCIRRACSVEEDYETTEPLVNEGGESA